MLKILPCANTYRPPTGDVKKALKCLYNSMLHFPENKRDIFILGDFNIVYKKKTTPACKSLIFFEKSKSQSQLIRNSTRSTKNDSTLIDLALTVSQYLSGTLNTFNIQHWDIYQSTIEP